MKHAVFDDFFAVLGNRQRVRILQYLQNGAGRSITEIGERLAVEQSAVSHNMKRLLDCHFVTVEPRGKERIYQINTDTVRPLFEHIDRHMRLYCANGCSHWE